tara:strand:+ start:454 stop:627 length:174 start_codon:yes stop_codon:yes gene_type:complete
MVEVFQVVIHQDKIGDSLVVEVVEDMEFLKVLRVDLMVQAVQEEYQVDHTMVQEMVH